MCLFCMIAIVVKSMESQENIAIVTTYNLGIDNVLNSIAYKIDLIMSILMYGSNLP